MKCSNCGYDFEGSFCPQCGTKAEQFDKRICHNCGAIVTGKFCSKCGTPTDDLAASRWMRPGNKQFPTAVSGNKKKGCLVPVLVAIAIFALIGMFGGADDGDSTSNLGSSGASVVAAPTASPEPTVSPEIASTPVPMDVTSETEDGTSSEILSMDDVAPMMETVIADNFENYTFDYDETGITVSVWDDDVAMGATLAAAGSQETVELWEELKDNMVTLCNSMVDVLEAANLKDAVVMVNILNDQNMDNTLLSVVNGVVVYDAVESAQ